MESRLFPLATRGFGVRTSLEANRLSCPRSADTALKPYLTLWTIFWLAKTSNKPISLTIWLAVNPFKLKLKSRQVFSLLD